MSHAILDVNLKVLLFSRLLDDLERQLRHNKREKLVLVANVNHLWSVFNQRLLVVVQHRQDLHAFRENPASLRMARHDAAAADQARKWLVELRMQPHHCTECYHRALREATKDDLGHVAAESCGLLLDHAQAEVDCLLDLRLIVFLEHHLECLSLLARLHELREDDVLHHVWLEDIEPACHFHASVQRDSLNRRGR